MAPVENPGLEWDRFVAADPGGTFCHAAGWAKLMREVLGHEPLYLTASDDAGRWHGVLPLVRVRSLLFGDYLVSMPFLNYGGPLGSAEARTALAREALGMAESAKVDLLELRSRGAPVPGELLRVNTRKITVTLDLPRDPVLLWKDGLEAKVRSQVRRPQKEGMVARFGPGELDAFYGVFAHNMRDLGTPVLPLPFFERIRDVFGEAFVLAAVYAGETPVAAGAGFVWGNEFELTWASSLRAYGRQAPNMLLYWSLMERMIERGVGVFNFGRCTPGGGTHRFKSQWGGVDEPLPWSQWSGSGTDSTPNPEGRFFRLATTAWSKLPLTIANRLGPPLARRIP